MVVAQLVERSLPTPEVRGSNPVIYIERLLSTALKFENTKIKEKRGRGWPILLEKKSNSSLF